MTGREHPREQAERGRAGRSSPGPPDGPAGPGAPGDSAALALAAVHRREDAAQEDLALHLAEVPEVEDGGSVAGEEAFVVKVRLQDVDALERTVVGRVPERRPDPPHVEPPA